MIIIPQLKLKYTDVISVAKNKDKVALNRDCRHRIITAYQLVNRYAYPIKKGEAQSVRDNFPSQQPIYGVNTGFGALASVILDQKYLTRLQENLIQSHAVGCGPTLDKEIVRAAMFLRANMLAKGYSGVRIELINTLLAMLNKNIVPIVPETGSVGASGDLAPLAFIALTLLGCGEVYYQNKIINSKIAFKKTGLKPIKLEVKEGLSLINGTEMMAAIGAIIIINAEFLAKVADIAATMSLVALQGNPLPFDLRLMRLKPHQGQIDCAKNLLKLLKGYNPKKNQVQDSYTLRCIPQVNGAVRNGISFAKEIVETEINSVTDNPIIIGKDILSGGNFHGQAISLAFDNLGISLATLGLISERRIFRLLDDKLSGLKPFLVENPGINSGLMMLQVLASAICAESKLLSNPASIQSLPTSASQEDFVSMGMTAANKTRRILDNTLTIIAIELICSRQAIELAKYKVPKGLKIIFDNIAQTIPYITKDRIFQNDIMNMKSLLQEDKFRKIIQDAVL